MHPTIRNQRLLLSGAIALLLLSACQKETRTTGGFNAMNDAQGVAKPAKLTKDFKQVNLVANVTGYGAARLDPTLVNPWGIAISPTGVFWPASTGSGFSQLYTSEGVTVRPPVAVPGPFTPGGGTPTGIVFNGSADFRIPNGQPARFIFAGLDGVISGWNGAAGNFAVRMFNNVGVSVYTGLAIGSHAGANYLYAADFAGREIDVFDKDYKPVNGMSFTDPSLPSGYAPFNIQNIEGKLYVMYAKVGPDGRSQAGEGLGYVSIFNTNGSFVKSFASGGKLNAPWGIAKAPASFFGEDNTGKKAVEGAILVGNFGDGRIIAYTLAGEQLGQLRAHGQPIILDGLWAITFAPPTATAIDPNRLYFAAGPNMEMDGLFGYLIKE